jgi:hypothetical protein
MCGATNVHVEDSDFPVSHKPTAPTTTLGKRANFLCCCASSMSLTQPVNQSFRQPRLRHHFMGWYTCLLDQYHVNSCGYRSIPINTIFRGMNIHLPAILMFTRGTRFWHTAMSIRIVQNQNARAAAISRVNSFHKRGYNGFRNFELACMSLSSDRCCHPLHR